MTTHDIGWAAVMVLGIWTLGEGSVRLVRRWCRPTPTTLEHQIGAVISDGMDRVDQLRWTGADAFQTLMPMPNGECWTVLVRRFPDETSARVAVGRAEVSA